MSQGVFNVIVLSHNLCETKHGEEQSNNCCEEIISKRNLYQWGNLMTLWSDKWFWNSPKQFLNSQDYFLKLILLILVFEMKSKRF